MIVTVTAPPGATSVVLNDRVALGFVCAAKGDEPDITVKPPITLSNNAANIINLDKASLL